MRVAEPYRRGNGIHMNGIHTYTKPSPPALFKWASIHVLPPDSQLTKSHWLTDWNNGCIKISDTCRYFSLVMCLFKRSLWRDAAWDAWVEWMDGGRGAGIVGVQKGWIMVHIQARGMHKWAHSVAWKIAAQALHPQCSHMFYSAFSLLRPAPLPFQENMPS